ncbi:MAG: hypothetical protein KGR68_10870 [Betaproteobacteria bacterium]|nr:hypothetical protein [Betaproteobacteria bacterium]
MHPSIAPGSCPPSSRAALAGMRRAAARRATLRVVVALAFTPFTGELALLHAQPLPSPLSPAWSDPRAASTALEQARRLYAEGQREAAMKVVDTALQNAPRDAALRFTRAVMLADSGRTEDAMRGFIELTQEFPELPEPHNNLATLHAARGDLDQARGALENAVRALPSYALAWENLGDVHLRIAERAWARAASLDNASAAQAKLKLARELIDRVSPAGARPAPVNLPGKRP